MADGPPARAIIQPTGWARIARRIRVPVGFLFAILYMWLARPTPRSLLFGLLVAIPGIIFRGLASGHVQKNEQLATTGPYAYTRNPLYLGSFIIALGFALASRNLALAFAMVLLITMIYLPVIRSEEVFLRQRFPNYDDYARRVPCLLPLGRRMRRDSSSFSWDLYVKHREYNAFLGTLAMTAALAIKMWWTSRL